MNLNRDRIDGLKINLRTARRAASADQVNRGRAWYPVARDIAEMIGNGDVRKGAGVIAALSPRMQWDVNVRKATAALAGESYACMGSSMAKVAAILDGADPADVLPTGSKTWNFFHNIIEPTNPAYVTIDAWAYRAATGDWSAVGPKNARDYAEVAAAYIEMAAEFGELPSAFQAGVWNWARETKH